MLGANEHGDLAWGRSHSLRFDGLAEGRKGFGASLSFGHAVFYVMYYGSAERLLRLRYEAHRSLKQIWPVQPEVAWPPTLLMRPLDLTPLTDIVHRNSAWVARAA